MFRATPLERASAGSFATELRALVRFSAAPETGVIPLA